MKIWTYLKEDHIYLDATLPDKESVFCFVANTCVQDRIVESSDIIYDALKKREQTMTTGIGKGIGLPHAVIPDVRDISMLLIRLAQPIDFKSLDSLPVDLIIAMIIPEHHIKLHLRLLASISMLCKNSEFLTATRNAKESSELWQCIKFLEENMAFH